MKLCDKLFADGRKAEALEGVAHHEVKRRFEALRREVRVKWLSHERKHTAMSAIEEEIEGSRGVRRRVEGKI